MLNIAHKFSFLLYSYRDAVFHANTSVVEIVTVAFPGCNFDRTSWKRISKLYPIHLNQLAYGDEANILVNVTLLGPEMRSLMDPHDDITCLFHKDGIQIGKHKANRREYNTQSDSGAILITCTVPRSLISADKQPLFDRVSLERGINLTQLRQQSLTSNPSITQTTTDPIPFCISSPSSDSTTSNNLTSNLSLPAEGHKYDLSICTAMMDSSRAKLAEWIEYHKLMGKYATAIVVIS